MKETLQAPQFQIDPHFNAAEAAQWAAPVPGTQTNILDLGNFNVIAPPDQSEKEIALQDKYAEMELEPGWNGMSEILAADLQILHDASVERFDNQAAVHPESALMLSSVDMIDDNAMARGDDMRYMNYFHHRQAFTTAIGRKVPEQSAMLLNDLYELTGAKVLRDDRTDPDQKTYRRYLVGNFHGKQLLFVEQGLDTPGYDPDMLPMMSVSVVDDMSVLKDLSQAEVRELYPYLGVQTYRYTKAQLPEVRENIRRFQAETDELTGPKSQ